MVGDDYVRDVQGAKAAGLVDDMTGPRGLKAGAAVAIATMSSLPRVIASLSAP